ncbi:MAG: dihydrodipicolinate synthase family protein, partial [Armatimonadota bacterium]
MTAQTMLATRPLWSATPTPLTDDLQIDLVSTRRLVDHQLRLGVDGLFILGSCGEGPWLPREQQRTFIREVCEYNAGRMTIGAQVTDNSASRIIENARIAAEQGADVAIMAAPWKLMGPLAKDRLRDLYLDAIEGSPLPMGIYDLGERDTTFVPLEVLSEALRHPKVVALKDSSGSEERCEAVLEIRAERPELRVMSGNEFDLPTYLGTGYDGLVLGGAIFNGY